MSKVGARPIASYIYICSVIVYDILEASNVNDAKSMAIHTDI